MKKIEYMKPAVRVKQVDTDSALMELGSVNTNTTVTDGFSKETDFEDDDFTYPTTSGNVWED